MDGNAKQCNVVFERFDPVKHYDWTSFDCGHQPFNDFLTSGGIQTELERRVTIPHLLLAIRDDLPPTVIGFFTLASSSLEKHLYPISNNQKKKLPYKTVPTIIIGKLAVCKSVQGQGVGKRVLAHAIKTAYLQSRDVGCLALYLNAIDGKEGFYRECGWIEIKDDSNGFVYPLKQYEDALKEKINNL
ncbi:putative acetyltransferase, GNAT family (plasmid) [Aliivibrio wodanis]|uniref:Putative acetyltransferase, GNAT family n=1 Tax=Aliivibrio wodanis TaxID=80852 RepID=A0A090IEC1_9GAMM|nr:putative acetyltransferase, GNAT family [Aliivibrio wodanis]